MKVLLSTDLHSTHDIILDTKQTTTAISNLIKLRTTGIILEDNLNNLVKQVPIPRHHVLLVQR